MDIDKYSANVSISLDNGILRRTTQLISHDGKGLFLTYSTVPSFSSAIFFQNANASSWKHARSHFEMSFFQRVINSHGTQNASEDHFPVHTAINVSPSAKS
jgi:hypothetical protein